MEEELKQAIKLLREYCDSGTSCKDCVIKEKIHCDSAIEWRAKMNVAVPYAWSEYNK